MVKVTVAFQIEKEIYDDILEQANKAERSVSGQIRFILKEWLA